MPKAATAGVARQNDTFPKRLQSQNGSRQKTVWSLPDGRQIYSINAKTTLSRKRITVNKRKSSTVIVLGGGRMAPLLKNLKISFRRKYIHHRDPGRKKIFWRAAAKFHSRNAILHRTAKHGNQKLAKFMVRNTIDDICGIHFMKEEKLEIKRLGPEPPPGTLSLDPAGGLPGLQTPCLGLNPVTAPTITLNLVSVPVRPTITGFFFHCDYCKHATLVTQASIPI
ncbi:hypothetical protein PoB_004050700 [Plakobranchus ocellatus]|uniref:60S ribosomal protein L28 n=1 Tax=Plakobranchus ocellatus TaxID=259542 RepID=A0AAV4B3B7_9GAST|nr:hypothetical protein PoB_004050700 [Plakobranchus ocellatus]